MFDLLKARLRKMVGRSKARAAARTRAELGEDLAPIDWDAAEVLVSRWATRPYFIEPRSVIQLPTPTPLPREALQPRRPGTPRPTPRA